MKGVARLRFFGVAVLVFNIWLVGRYNLQGAPAGLLTFGFAIAYEFLVMRPAKKSLKK